MFIRDLSERTGLASSTIRFYESKGLLPAPRRAANNYRQYAAGDVERLRFIAGARTLGLGLDDIAEILGARDSGIAPCQRVLDALAERIAAVDQRIAELLDLRESLTQLHAQGADLRLDDVQGDACVCHLLKTYRTARPIVNERGELDTG